MRFGCTEPGFIFILFLLLFLIIRPALLWFPYYFLAPFGNCTIIPLRRFPPCIVLLPLLVAGDRRISSGHSLCLPT
ncbi:hypothetical protein HD806DRAFT_488135 [Xylariaceae sp. AK1471]|nr:hypothetical protein HD806DRAFT_488135 [Xylariaceae sp. AK1471]